MDSDNSARRKPWILRLFDGTETRVFRALAVLFACCLALNIVTRHWIFAMVSLGNLAGIANFLKRDGSSPLTTTWRSELAVTDSYFYVSAGLLAACDLAQADQWWALLLCLILPLPLGAFLVRRHRAKAREVGERRVLEAIRHYTPRTPLDSVTYPVFDDAWEAARAQDDAIHAQIYSKWQEVDLPAPRKIQLIKARITPEHSLSPDVVAMTAEDLGALSAMEDLMEEEVSEMTKVFRRWI